MARIGHIDQMEQQVGPAHFLQRALERFDQRVRDLVDEADGIDEHDFIAVRQTKRAGCRVECRKELIFDEDTGARERVHQGGFSGVGVTDERNCSKRRFVALLALQRAGALDRFQSLFQMTDALADAPAVDFELRFTRAARADAAAQPRQMRPLARQARQQIFELCKFYLHLALVAARALGENIEDQLAAIDDAHFERRFQIALLRRRQVFVDDDEVGVAFLQGLLNFVDLAAADQSRRRDVFHLLAVLFDHGGAGGFRQSFEFLQVEVERRCMVARRQRYAYEHGAFLRLSR